jgi:acyl-CoA synthetase (AMP-forming)/AMP-acid ligase II
VLPPLRCRRTSACPSPSPPPAAADDALGGPVKWTISEVLAHSDALASGLHEIGLRKGDALAVWLQGTDYEQLMTQLAAVKLGLVHVSLDAGMTDKAALRKALSDSAAAALVYPPAGADLLEDACHAVTKHDASTGQILRATDLPNLRYLVASGFDIEKYAHGLRYLLAYDSVYGDLDALAAAVDDGALLSVQYDAAGNKVHAKSHKEVAGKGVWPVVDGILKRDMVRIGA